MNPSKINHLYKYIISATCFVDIQTGNNLINFRGIYYKRI